MRAKDLAFALGSRHGIRMILLVVWLIGSPVWAQSPSYHLERLQIQGRAFLQTLGPADPGGETRVSVGEQLEQAASNSVWARQMVVDDVERILSTGAELSDRLSGEVLPDDLLAARSTLESLARRLRVSSAALDLSPSSRTAMDFLLLELEESARVMERQREQLLAQERERRALSRRESGFSVGYGFGAWGVPYGWGTYYPYGCGYGPGPFYGGWGFPRVYGIGPGGCR